MRRPTLCLMLAALSLVRCGSGGTPPAPDVTHADVAADTRPDDAGIDGQFGPDGGDAGHDASAEDAALVDVGSPAQADASVVINVNAARALDPVRRVQLGVNHRWSNNAYGAWTASGMDPAVVADVARAHVGLLRYPAGTRANMFFLANAVGATRGCQVIASQSETPAGSGNWVWDSPPEATTPYGPAEHFAWTEPLGIATDVMVPFTNHPATDAADAVEYYNAPDDGSNPSGGVDWAHVRAMNGHAAPYGVKIFEVGNEPYLDNQRYWMQHGYGAPATAALGQYLHGDHATRFVDQDLGTGCDYTGPSHSDGSAGQAFRIWYPPATGVVVKVDGTAWTKVPDLATAGATDAVFTANLQTGVVRFGDGTHGRVPPRGARLTVSYALDHDGFAEFARAMKAVDPTIDVCAAWGTTDFVDRAAADGVAYDCVVRHPYTFVPDGVPTADAMYEVYMHGEEQHAGDMRDLIADVQTRTSGRSYVAASEYGAIGQVTAIANVEATQLHATYMGAQLARVLDEGLPWAEGGDLTAAGLRSFVGHDGSAWVYSSHALVYQAVASMFTDGGHTVPNAVTGNPMEGTAPMYPALVTAAALDAAGHLDLLVVNRAMTDRVLARLELAGFSPMLRAHAWTVNSADGSYTAYNDATHPDRVVLTEADLAASHSFTYRFEPHSVTRIRFTAM